MKLLVAMRFFSSALGTSTLPACSSANPYRANLMIDGCEDQPGVEMLAANGEEGEVMTVTLRTLRPDADRQAIVAGSECFLLENGRTVGRGTVREVVADAD